MRSTGVVLVILQFACLLFLLITTPVRTTPWGLALIISAASLLLWALLAMRASRLRVLPNPARDARLVTSGPYHFIRHPMYTSLILGSVGLVVIDPSASRISVLLLLIAVLVVKLNVEEKLLAGKFPEYESYRARTFRLVPYVY